MTEPRTHGAALGNSAKRLYDSHQAAKAASDKIAQERQEEAEKAAQEQPPGDGKGQGQ